MRNYNYATIALWGALGSVVALQADDRSSPTGVVDREADVRKAAEKAEVHGVAVYHPDSYRIEPNDVSDWPKLIETLRVEKGVAGRVWQLLPTDVLDVIKDEKTFRLLSTRPIALEVVTLKGKVAGALSDIIKRPDFYTEEAFKEVRLTKEIKAAIALGKHRTGLQTLRMNRAILRASFPDAIADAPNFRTVRVRVQAGKNVILVLTSYLACRWEVEIEKGGNVTGVVLCGYEYHEVSGVDAPVAYRTVIGPDGKRTKQELLWARDSEDKLFKKFAESVKVITGQEFATFQGKMNIDKEPFIVRAAAK